MAIIPVLGALEKHDVSLLRMALQDRSRKVRVLAAQSLWWARKNAAEVVPALLDGLSEPTSATETANTAAFALKRIGTAAAFARADLQKHLDSPHEMVRYYIKQLLEIIEDE